MIILQKYYRYRKYSYCLFEGIQDKGQSSLNKSNTTGDINISVFKLYCSITVRKTTWYCHICCIRLFVVFTLTVVWDLFICLFTSLFLCWCGVLQIEDKELHILAQCMQLFSAVCLHRIYFQAFCIQVLFLVPRRRKFKDIFHGGTRGSKVPQFTNPVMYNPTETKILCKGLWAQNNAA